MSVVLLCEVCVSGLYGMRGVYECCVGMCGVSVSVVLVCVVCLSSMCGMRGVFE